MAMMINLNQRLIVAVDLKPTPPSFTQRGYGDIKERVLRFADNLKDTGVILKLNSALR